MGVSPDVSIRRDEDLATDAALENLVIAGKEFSARSDSRLFTVKLHE